MLAIGGHARRPWLSRQTGSRRVRVQLDSRPTTTTTMRSLSEYSNKISNGDNGEYFDQRLVVKSSGVVVRRVVENSTLRNARTSSRGVCSAGLVTTRAILESRNVSSSSSSSSSGEEDLSATFDGIDLMDIAELSAKVSQLISEENAASERERERERGSFPSREELARLESSLAEDAVGAPELDMLTSSKTADGKRMKGNRALSRASSAANLSLISSDEALIEERENGESLTEGLAARSARARAVARGVRSRPPKASVATMVQTQAKERVRGVNLQPRKNTPQLGQRSSYVGSSTDSMKSYLKDIGSVTLLNAGQEVELAKRIQDLMHLDSIRANLEEESGPGANITDYQWASAAGLSPEALAQRLHDGKAAL
jgi:hypothetical protein